MIFKVLKFFSVSRQRFEFVSVFQREKLPQTQHIYNACIMYRVEIKGVKFGGHVPVLVSVLHSNYFSGFFYFADLRFDSNKNGLVANDRKSFFAIRIICTGKIPFSCETGLFSRCISENSYYTTKIIFSFEIFH